MAPLGSVIIKKTFELLLVQIVNLSYYNIKILKDSYPKFKLTRKMPKYKSVLFDLDGTLLHTAKDIMAACNYTLNKFNYKTLDESILIKKVTAGMREMLKLSVPKEEWELAGVETTMRDCFAQYYTSHIDVYTRPFDGISELMAELKSQKIKTAVITNKYEYMAKKILGKFSEFNDLSLILGCDSLTHSKPHPEPLLKAASLLNLHPEECIYVGDHKNDILAARAAHMDSIVALWGYGIYECEDVKTWGTTLMAKDVNALKSLIFA